MHLFARDLVRSAIEQHEGSRGINPEPGQQFFSFCLDCADSGGHRLRAGQIRPDQNSRLASVFGQKAFQLIALRKQIGNHALIRRNRVRLRIIPVEGPVQMLDEFNHGQRAVNALSGRIPVVFGKSLQLGNAAQRIRLFDFAGLLAFHNNPRR